MHAANSTYWPYKVPNGPPQNVAEKKDTVDKKLYEALVEVSPVLVHQSMFSQSKTSVSKNGRVGPEMRCITALLPLRYGKSQSKLTF